MIIGRTNSDIRKSKGRIPHWVIAQRLGISENTLIRWLRVELNDELKQRILDIIHEVHCAEDDEVKCGSR